jgi:hypothetical protein
MERRRTHTRGPWKLLNPSCDNLAVGLPDGSNIVEWPTNYTLEDLANARLIASAPQLLFALREAAQIIQHDNCKCPFGVPYTPKGQRCECNYHASYYMIHDYVALADSESLPDAPDLVRHDADFGA